MTFTTKCISITPYLYFLCAIAVNSCAQQPSVTVPTPSSAEPQGATSKQVVAVEKALIARKPRKSNKPPQQSGPTKSPQRANSKPSKYPSVILNSSFELRYGQKRSLPNSGLNFKITKINDSRCPLEMQCANQGNATVTLTLYRNDDRIDAVNIDGSSSALIKDRQYSYRIQLLELQPYPTVQFIQPQHYVAELIITQHNSR